MQSGVEHQRWRSLLENFQHRGWSAAWCRPALVAVESEKCTSIEIKT